MTHVRDIALLRELRGQSHSARDRLVIQDKAEDMYHVIRWQDIDWIEAKNRGVLIHVGTQPYYSRQGLTEVERQLDPGLFMRIHRSRIVNRTRVIAVKRLWKGEYSVLLRSGKSLGTGRSYQPVLEARDYMRSMKREARPGERGRGRREFKVTPAGLERLRDARRTFEGLWRALDPVSDWQ